MARENQQSDAAEKKSPFKFFNSFQMADFNIQVPSDTSGIPPDIFCSRIGLSEIGRCYPSCILRERAR